MSKYINIEKVAAALNISIDKLQKMIPVSSRERYQNKGIVKDKIDLSTDNIYFVKSGKLYLLPDKVGTGILSIYYKGANKKETPEISKGKK